MIQRVEILPYHTLGVHKYEAMGKEYKLNGIKRKILEQLETAKTLFGEYFNTVYLKLEKTNLPSIRYLSSVKEMSPIIFASSPFYV